MGREGDAPVGIVLIQVVEVGVGGVGHFFASARRARALAQCLVGALSGAAGGLGAAGSAFERWAQRGGRLGLVAFAQRSLLRAMAPSFACLALSSPKSGFCRQNEKRRDGARSPAVEAAGRLERSVFGRASTQESVVAKTGLPLTLVNYAGLAAYKARASVLGSLSVPTKGVRQKKLPGSAPWGSKQAEFHNVKQGWI